MEGETSDKLISVTTFIANGLSSTELRLSHFCIEIFSILQVRRAECQERDKERCSRIEMVIDYLRYVSGASLTADLYCYTTAPVWGV
jgi:hypothetical protein